MSFINRLGGIARSIGDKASDALEVTKLNGKISNEKAAVAEDLKQIGEFYYKLYQTGELVEPKLAELYASIDEHNKAIDEALLEIARLQSESTGQMAQTAAANAAAVAAGDIPCPSCGKPNPVGTKFCAECGTKMELPETQACPSCGVQVAVGAKFCGECGHRFP
ncbi:MAG: zinc ribbon domain-containing protein [Symbiobacteriaceae bacterium]|nr:zinc ribbon domain-containing protein [Symbiobacteriaceae bacterium]